MSRTDHACRPRRESLSKRLGKTARLIKTRDGHRCVYCSSTEKLSLDHLKPRASGGADVPHNLVTACLSCNSIRKNKPLHIWAVYAATVLGFNFSSAAVRAQARRSLRDR